MASFMCATFELLFHVGICGIADDDGSWESILRCITKYPAPTLERGGLLQFQLSLQSLRCRRLPGLWIWIITIFLIAGAVPSLSSTLVI